MINQITKNLILLSISLVTIGCGPVKEMNSDEVHPNRLGVHEEYVKESGPCKSTKPTVADVKTFFDESDLTPVNIWNYHYIASPCAYHGKVAYQGSVWVFTIYPSGYGRLQPLPNDEEAIHFTCYDCSLFKDQNLTKEELPLQ